MSDSTDMPNDSGQAVPGTSHEQTTEGVYATAALIYYEGGWRGVLPLPAGRKKSPPTGWTGHGAPYPSRADIQAWTEDRPAGNVALRMPPDVVGIDVDAYGQKPGGQSFAALEARLGPLPPTWTSTARTDEVSGIRFFRVPPGTRLRERAAGPGIELIHAGHRYAVVWPSTNPDAGGAPYVWIGPTGTRGVGAPRVHDLPELPTAWLEHLSGASADPFGDSEPVTRAESTDPFALPSHPYSVDEAKAYVLPDYNAFKAMTDEDVNFNQRLNDLAVLVSHFVPEFFTRADAEAWLYRAAEHNGSVAYQGASQVRATIASGLNANTWKACKREPEPEGSQEPPKPTGDAVDALLAELLDIDALKALPPAEPLIWDVLDLDSESWLIAEAGGFKSFVALDWACHVVTGRPWRGRPVRRGEVVYVVAEGKKGIGKRVQAWTEVYGEEPRGLLVLPRPVQVRDGAGWATLVEACRRIQPVMVVLDTQARITVGLNENDNGEMGVLTEAVRRLREATGACVLVVHHIGRNGENARGASAIDGAQDSELKVIRPTDERDRKKLTARIVTDKQKDASEDVEFDIQMRVVDLGVSPEGRPLSSLAVEPLSTDPFGAVAVRARPDWEERYTENQADVALALAEHGDAFGATRAQVRMWVKQRRAHDGRPDMPATSFDSAVRDLVAREAVVRKGGRLFYAKHLEENE